MECSSAAFCLVLVSHYYHGSRSDGYVVISECYNGIQTQYARVFSRQNLDAAEVSITGVNMRNTASLISSTEAAAIDVHD